MIGWQVLGRKSLYNVHTRSRYNPADDPSRDVDLRAPEEAEDWLRPLLKPEDGRKNHWEPLPLERCWSIQGFAGQGLVAVSLAELGIRCRALEAFPKPGTYRREHDMTALGIIWGLVASIRAGHLRGAFLDIPCSS